MSPVAAVLLAVAGAVGVGRARHSDDRLVVDGGDPFVCSAVTLARTVRRLRLVVVYGGLAGLVLVLLGTAGLAAVL